MRTCCPVQVDASELDGLPQDYIDARPADENGMVTITTDYPDLYPVMTYAKSDELRKALRLKARSPRLSRQQGATGAGLIAKRREAGGHLGLSTPMPPCQWTAR